MKGHFEKRIFQYLSVRLLWLFLPSNQSIIVSRTGVATKKSLPPVKVFSFFVKFTAAIFPAVSPQRGLTSINGIGENASGNLFRGQKSVVESGS